MKANKESPSQQIAWASASLPGLELKVWHALYRKADGTYDSEYVFGYLGQTSIVHVPRAIEEAKHSYKLLDHKALSQELAFPEPEHVPMAERPTPPRNGGEKATEKQIAFMYSAGKRIGLPQSGVRALAIEAFGKEPEALSKAQASQLIDELQKRPG